MPGTEALLTFAVALFFLEVSPGPDMMLILARGIGQGRKIALLTVLGMILVAGIVQIVAIAVAFLAFLFRNHADANVPYMLIMGAQFTQLLTIALLIMGRQK